MYIVSIMSHVINTLEERQMIDAAVMEREKEAIVALFARMNDAWARGDADAFGSCYTEDCDYVTFNGMHLKGRRQNVELHREMLNGFLFRGSRLEGRIEDLRFLNGTTALAHGTGALLMRWQKKSPKSRLSINTTVLVKIDGAWMITAFHNCRIREMGRFARWLMGR